MSLKDTNAYKHKKTKQFFKKLFRYIRTIYI